MLRPRLQSLNSILTLVCGYLLRRETRCDAGLPALYPARRLSRWLGAGIRLQSKSWQHNSLRCWAEIQASTGVVTQCNEHAEAERFQFLEQQAVGALQACVNEFSHPVFPCALIASDVVILHLLHKHGLIDQGMVHARNTMCRLQNQCPP